MKKIIRLTEGDLHRIIKESTRRILREYTDDYEHYDPPYPDYVSKEEVEKESIVMCTFFIDTNELVLISSAEAVPDYSGDNWCSIDVKPVLEYDNSEGYIIEDLKWEYIEVEPSIADSEELWNAVDAAVHEHFDEISQKMYHECPYYQ